MQRVDLRRERLHNNIILRSTNSCIYSNNSKNNSDSILSSNYNIAFMRRRK